MRSAVGNGVVYILEEAQQIGNSFPFAICQHRVVDAVSRASCTQMLAMLHAMWRCQDAYRRSRIRRPWCIG
jgi:hypothetical protein